MPNTTQHWVFKKFNGNHLLLHIGGALLSAALTLRQLILTDSFTAWLLVAADIYYFRYTYQYWQGWHSSQGRRQYISLYQDEMEYFAAPAGQGRLKYEQIRYIYILMEDNEKYPGKHFIIEYRLPGDSETLPDLRELAFNLDFLLPPADSGKPRNVIPDLSMHATAFEAALRQRCPRLYSLIQREGLRNHAWLEVEKKKTRQWLQGFKKQ